MSTPATPAGASAATTAASSAVTTGASSAVTTGASSAVTTAASSAAPTAAPSATTTDAPAPAPPPPPAASSKYPPYPAFDPEPVPPSVAETITAGRGLRVTHKSVYRPQPLPLPKPARPKTPKVTDIKLPRRQAKAHASCLRRHGAVLTDRLEQLAKPKRRAVIYLWREYGEKLPPETIERFRGILNADEPFKPDQAYQFFINCRKTKKKAAKCSLLKKDMQAVVTDKRFVWARNATVAFARGIQQRLSRPGTYRLADGMLRLSNVILAETCGYMKMRTPSRRCTNSKAKFMIEMSDKIAVWIDEILSESDDRMLMMDYDEDEEVERSIIDETILPSTATSATSTAPSSTGTSATDGKPAGDGKPAADGKPAVDGKPAEASAAGAAAIPGSAGAAAPAASAAAAPAAGAAAAPAASAAAAPAAGAAAAPAASAAAAPAAGAALAAAPAAPSAPSAPPAPAPK